MRCERRFLRPCEPYKKSRRLQANPSTDGRRLAERCRNMFVGNRFVTEYIDYELEDLYRVCWQFAP